MESSTKTIFQLRNEIISVGGYGQYHKACSQKLLQLRRKLKIATPRGRKYEPRSLHDISAEEYSKNADWRDYIIFSAERAWAHAMDMKSLHTNDSGEATLSGPVRSHVLSRLVKASKAASHLVDLSKQQAEDQQGKYFLAAHGAYWRLLEGATAFESQKWEKCLKVFSEAYVLYTALDDKDDGVFYRDWISDNVEPSIRYAAYQLRLPRTLAVQKVVARHASKDSPLVKLALEISPTAIADDKAASEEQSSVSTAIIDAPSSISWRGRTVRLEDARIAQALGGVKQAESALASTYSTDGEQPADEKAAAYEEILAKSQDAVDATKTALDELATEGVAPSDPRVQSLQITRTAVNYDMVGWRIGRNRVLCGKNDGADFEDEPPKAGKGKTKGKAKSGAESIGKRLARLRSRVVLYDTTLDSLDAIRDLPGIAADQDLLKRLASRRAYFAALRSLAIARSHALLGNSSNALALLTKAVEFTDSVTATDDNEAAAKSALPQLYLTSAQAKTVKQLVEGLKIQYHALVELDKLDADAVKAEQAKAAWSTPLIERLNEYPAGGADLTNLVSYPPKLRPVPVKPIFLDVAWNYIDYPGQERAEPDSDSEPEPVAAEKPAKRGWFGFGGRS